MRRRRSALSSLWLASAEASLAVWQTLSHRVPMLVSGTATPAEKRKMVVEKAEAGLAAAEAATEAAARIARRRKPIATPLAALEAAATITYAAARPFHTRVAANAKRLSRGKGAARRPNGPGRDR